MVIYMYYIYEYINVIYKYSYTSIYCMLLYGS